MAEFYNSIQKIPYLKLETVDGKVKLGINRNLHKENDFSDIINVTECKIDVRSDVALIEFTIEILRGAWTNASFDAVFDSLVEEPYRTKQQRAEDSSSTPINSNEGVWNLQFGYRDQNGQDNLSIEIQCVTLNNELSVLPEARGAIVIQKQMIMLPLVYLNQTQLVDLKNVREYISLQTDAAQNETQTNIIPIKIFELMVKDLKAIYGSEANGLPELNNFIAAGDNFLNVGAEDAFNSWLKSPLKELGSLSKIRDTETKDMTSVRQWLSDWLRENNMELYLIPLRVFNSGLGFLIRYAPSPDDRVSNTHQESMDPTAPETQPYRYSWRPALDILDNKSIIENTTFSYVAGEYSAPYIEAFKKEFANRTSKDDRSGSLESDATIKDKKAANTVKLDPKSLFLEFLKFANKAASIQIMGQPKISIMDVIPINANNILFDGMYEIIGVIHTITQQGFTTDLDCLRIHDKINSTIAGIETGEPK